MSARISAVREELGGRLNDTNKGLDSLHTDLVARNDETNRAISRLYEVIVRRDEHQQLISRLERMEGKWRS